MPRKTKNHEQADQGGVVGVGITDELLSQFVPDRALGPRSFRSLRFRPRSDA